MLTMEQFDSLEVGDVVELPSPFPSLSAETAPLHVTQRSQSCITFTAVIFGVTAGYFTCTKSGSKLLWGR